MPQPDRIITRTTCRVCGAAGLEPVFSLGERCVSDFLPSADASVIRAPLDLVLCDRCRLLQLRHTAPQEIMYTGTTGIARAFTDTMRRALRDITESVQRLVPLRAGDIVLDIGANHGTLLAAFSVPGQRAVGCEPGTTSLLRRVTRHVIHDFWNAAAFERMFPGEQARVVTAIGMFYDMEDPNQFVADAARVLAETASSSPSSCACGR